MADIAKPELLSPAGTPEAMRAAVAAGADAVYFGADAFNARANARNFSADELARAVGMLHAHNVKAHVTLNVQVFDREMQDALRCAENVYRAGADAIIVSDLGLARLLRTYFPEIELHASTQASGHSVRDAEYFASLGFSRMVCARELSAADIRTLAEKSPIGIEMFVHGAICVSVSGQCLFSSMVGGRSGNRGECAQPCRLPYKCAQGNGYPLSPKDMCLAGHMAEIQGLGVCSLKIEGRMKSPEYVYRVTELYRRLIDEGRSATESEIKPLSAVFSRSGFTDAYFTGSVRSNPNAMMGVRTEADKDATRESAFTVPEPKKVPIDAISAVFRLAVPSALTVRVGERSVTVAGAIPDAARTRPLTAEYVSAQLCKFGSTEYAVTDKTVIDIDIDDGILLPASAINKLRRRAADALSGVRVSELRENAVPLRERIKPSGKPILTAEFLRAGQISKRAREYFDSIYLPLPEYDTIANGVVMPPVIYDRDTERVRGMIADAVKAGAESCILSGPGQMSLLREYGLRVIAGHRYNICNTESAAAAAEAGADIATASPEASAAQMRDMASRVPMAAVVYGRVPLMVTERCIIRAAAGDKCKCGDSPVRLCDRRGVRFPMWKTSGCGTVIYNSVPIWMGDKKDELSRLTCRVWHFMFTDEDAAAVDGIIDNFERGGMPQCDIRRIK